MRACVCVGQDTVHRTGHSASDAAAQLGRVQALAQASQDTARRTALRRTLFRMQHRLVRLGVILFVCKRAFTFAVVHVDMWAPFWASARMAFRGFLARPCLCVHAAVALHVRSSVAGSRGWCFPCDTAVTWRQT